MTFSKLKKETIPNTVAMYDYNPLTGYIDTTQGKI
jgi:hypothetical protein